MTTVCAWCGKTLNESSGAGGWVSHAICEGCAVDLEYSRISISDFLERLPGPVFATDDDVRLVGANQTLCETISAERDQVVGKLGGEVLQCIYSFEEGGCGRAVHCSGCTIRGEVNRTRETGAPGDNVAAFTYVKTPQGVLHLALRISTQKVGPAILVRVEALETSPS